MHARLPYSVMPVDTVLLCNYMAATTATDDADEQGTELLIAKL